jgi:hypothetical protein
MEEWRKIEGLDGYYEISNYGRIRSIDRVLTINGQDRSYRGRQLTPFANWNGYLKIVLTYKGKDYRLSIARLVAKHFIENAENKPEVNHIDFNKKNNHVSNLEWVSREENLLHAQANRNLNPDRRLARQVRSLIRQDYTRGYTAREISRVYRITQARVYKIGRRTNS